MNPKVLIVYNSPILFDILREIKENFNFEIIASDENFFHQIDFDKFENYTIISQLNNNIKNCNLISDIPIKIDKVIEKINIGFLSSKFLDQSEIKIGKYNLDLNSRKITNEENEVSLTEKETELIIFFKLNKFVSLKDLQKKVWKHSSELETHTVETHIYRLRKKFLEIFKDNNFINHGKKGYFLN